MKNKKYLLVLVIVMGSLALLMRSKERKEIIDEETSNATSKFRPLEKVKLKSESKVKAIAQEVAKKKIELQNKTGSKSIEVELVEEFHSKSEQAWLEEVRALIVDELGNGPDVYENYLKIRDEYHALKGQLLREFKEQLASESVLPDFRDSSIETLDVTEVRNKIDSRVEEDFQRELGELLGEVGRTRFNNIRENFNDQLKFEMGSDFPLLIIEY